MLPLSLVSLFAAVIGRQRWTVASWRWLRTRLLDLPAVPEGRPRTRAVAGHAMGSLLLGVMAVVPLGVEVLWLLRAVLYGFVDSGPYDHSWGGPTRGGAWVAHFLIGTPEALAGLAALAGIAALHQRLTAALDGARTPRWLMPTVVVAGLATALLFVAWTRQL
ncbi:hypothetical protein [Asanoa ishikariensis]|uniref:hypothetical protein n=1 Tax=Asanoa ishikariensis TaxID=137265 RepID=UPI000B83DB08|nr:hypothetical protein [Asanoa ishikariensis]